MKLILIFLSFFAFIIAPTFSQNLTEVVQLQLLKGWRAENGTHISGLKITLSPGWKTYWKQPGETGLVPHFDWTGSKNVSAVKVLWPHPSIFDEDNFQSIGYKNKVILPIEFTPLNLSKVIKPKLKITLGVCEDLCVPISRVLRTKLRPSKTTIDQEIITYYNLLPKWVSKAKIKHITCGVETRNNSLVFESNIEMVSKIFNVKAVAIELNQSKVWFDIPIFRAINSSLQVIAEIQNFDEGPLILDRSNIIITVLGDHKSIYFKGC